MPVHVAPGPSRAPETPTFIHRSPFSRLPASPSAIGAHGTLAKKSQGPPRTPSPLPAQLSSWGGPSGHGSEAGLSWALAGAGCPPSLL